MLVEFGLATSRGTHNPFRFIPALTCLEDRTTPAPMPTKVVPLMSGTVGCDAYTPVVYAWTQKTDPYVLMLVSPEFKGSFTIYASTQHGLVVQENVRPVHGVYVPFVFPQGGATDLVVLAKADPGQSGWVPYLLYGQLGFFSSDCPPQHHAPAHPSYPPASPPVSPPPYVPPPAGLEEFSVTSIFLDGQPGPGLEEIGRFAVGPNSGTVETFVVRDDEGGFAGVVASTVALRRYDEAVGAFGPVLGNATVVDANTLRITGIGELVNPTASDNQFTLSVDLVGALQLNSAKAFGTVN